MRIIYLIILISAINSSAATLDQFLSALSTVESSNNDSAVGDGGRAIGRFQIWEIYYRDAREFSLRRGDKFRLGNTTYADCRNPEIARRVVLAYFNRYGNKYLNENDWESLARLHNLGASWVKKSYLADNYWKKIHKQLFNSAQSLCNMSYANITNKCGKSCSHRR